MNFIERRELATSKGMIEGTMFVLDCEIENPSPDRRCKHDWRLLKKVDKGARFMVVIDRDHPAAITLERVDWRHSILYRLSLMSDLFPVIAPHLVPVEETLDDILHKAGYSASAEEILDLFVKQGRVSLDDVRAAVHTIRHQDDDVTADGSEEA